MLVKLNNDKDGVYLKKTPKSEPVYLGQLVHESQNYIIFKTKATKTKPSQNVIWHKQDKWEYASTIFLGNAISIVKSVELALLIRDIT